MLHHVEKIDPTTKGIVAACYPHYTGKKVKLSTNPPTRIESYWDRGSRRYYVFYSLDTGTVINVESNHPVYEAGKPNHLEKLPERILLVEHTIFCGKDLGITIYANASDLAPMLPKNEAELTDDERIVLTFTRSYKNTYGGDTNIRFKEARRVHGITAERWESAKVAMTTRGYLNKQGAITTSGKNAIEGKELRYPVK